MTASVRRVALDSVYEDFCSVTTTAPEVRESAEVRGSLAMGQTPLRSSLRCLSLWNEPGNGRVHRGLAVEAGLVDLALESGPDQATHQATQQGAG
jgi:hypothetical protein